MKNLLASLNLLETLSANDDRKLKQEDTRKD
jgi:hypothetical protein